MATTFDVLYLGTVAALDPTEGNIIAENAGTIVGTTFGSSGDPLNTHIHTLTPGTTSYTGGQLNDAYDVDNNIANEQFRIDGGVNQTMDAVVVYNATVTYVDGTTASITAVLFQDTAGRLYLAPEVTQNADQAVLEAKPIQSLKLNSVSSDETLLTASRDVAEFMDVITGTTGNDTMNPGYTDANGDIIDGADGNNDYIDGGSGNDSINAGLGDDIVVGGNGNDTITGDAGNDTLYGNDGNDIFVIVDDDDTDVIVGGENTGDFDAIAFAHFAAAQGVTVTYTGSEAGSYDFIGTTAAGTFTGIEAIWGTSYADVINAAASTTGANIAGNAGNDTITGGSAADTLSGGDNNDSITGGAGADTIYGDNGNDALHGGDDADVIYGGSGTDTLWGDAGNDVLNGEIGNDTIWGGTGNDTINGGLDNDALYGESGDDTFLYWDYVAGWGVDTVVGGETGETGGDTLDFSAFTTKPITVTYSGTEAGTATDGTSTVAFTEIENLVLGAGNDFVSAGADTLGIDVVAGDGADTIWGGSGADSVHGGSGADEIFGDAGADLIYGEAGNDDLGGDAGDDTIWGGDGNDWIQGNGGTNELYGESGDDTFEVFTGQGGTDKIVGGETGETAGDTLDFTGTSGASVTFTGNEAGTYTAGTASGSFSQIEAFDLTDQADSLNASASSAAVNVDAGAGNDTITGGSGNDTFDGGTGDDRLTGGTGNDTFLYTAGDGRDTIADFNAGNTGTLSDGNSANNDFIDLSAFYDNIWELQADQADDGILNQSNYGVDGVDYSDNTSFGTGSLTFTGAAADGSFFTVENTGVACYLAGTLIRTPAGEVPVETLRPGDKLITRDHGPRPVRWIGAATVDRADLAPILIRAGALGPGLPARDLLVSPQHRMLVRSRIARRMTGRDEVLVAATLLCALPGIRAAPVPGPWRYVHLLCDRHELIYAEGAPSETLLPGPQARAAMGPAAWTELTGIFPQIADILGRYPPARTIPAPARQKDLARRHRKNRAPLVDPAL